MPANAPTPVVPKWEYLALTRKSENYLVNDLNYCGQQGWEVITAMYYKDIKGVMVWTAFLKRLAVGLPPTDIKGAAGAASAGGAKATAEESGALKGFDLSGDDFQIKG